MPYNPSIEIRTLRLDFTNSEKPLCPLSIGVPVSEIASSVAAFFADQCYRLAEQHDIGHVEAGVQDVWEAGLSNSTHTAPYLRSTLVHNTLDSFKNVARLSLDSHMDNGNHRVVPGTCLTEISSKARAVNLEGVCIRDVTSVCVIASGIYGEEIPVVGRIEHIYAPSAEIYRHTKALYKQYKLLQREAMLTLGKQTFDITEPNLTLHDERFSPEHRKRLSEILSLMHSNAQTRKAMHNTDAALNGLDNMVSSTEVLSEPIPEISLDYIIRPFSPPVDLTRRRVPMVYVPTPSHQVA